MSCKDEVCIDGVTYRKVEAKPGTRHLVVIDKGWIFCGDVTEELGRLYLDRAVHVIRWESVGFAGIVADPKPGKTVLKSVPSRVDIPLEAEIFRVPVKDDWGL